MMNSSSTSSSFSVEPIQLSNEWNWGLIFLSFCVSSLGINTCLKVLKQRTSDYGKRNLLLLLLAASSLSSVGIYSMTAVGMVSLSFVLQDSTELVIEPRYHAGLTTLSCFSTVAAAALGFLVCPKHYAHLSLASSDMGDSISPNVAPLFKQFFRSTRSWLATVIFAGVFILCHFTAIYSQSLPSSITKSYDEVFLGCSIALSFLCAMLAVFVIFALPLLWRRNMFVMALTSMFVGLFLCLVEYFWLNTPNYFLVPISSAYDQSVNHYTGTSGLVNSTVFLATNVPISIVCCLVIIGLFMYRRYRFLVQETSKVNSLLLSALIFDCEGKQILMSPVTNTTPSVEIVKHYEKRGMHEFTQFNSDFLQLFNASFHWKDLYKLLRQSNTDSTLHPLSSSTALLSPVSPLISDNNNQKNKRKPSSRNPAAAAAARPIIITPTHHDINSNNHQSRVLFRAFVGAVEQMATMLHCDNLSQLGILYWKPLERICILVLKASPDQMKHFQSTTEFKFQFPEQLNDWVVQRAYRRLNASPTPAAQLRSLVSGLLSSPQFKPRVSHSNDSAVNAGTLKEVEAGTAPIMHKNWMMDALQYYEAIHVPLIGYNLSEKLNSWLFDLAGELLLSTDVSLLEDTVQEWRHAPGMEDVNSVLHLKQLVQDERQWERIDLKPVVKAKIRLILFPSGNNQATPPMHPKTLLSNHNNNNNNVNTTPSASTTSIQARASTNNNNIHTNNNNCSSNLSEPVEDYASYNLHSLSSYYLGIYSVHVRPTGLEVLLPHVYGPLTFLPMVKLDSIKIGAFNSQCFSLLKRFASQAQFAHLSVPKFRLTLQKMIERQLNSNSTTTSITTEVLESKVTELQAVDNTFVSFLDELALGAEELSKLFQHQTIKPIFTLSSLSECHVVHLKPDIHVLLFVNLKMVGSSLVPLVDAAAAAKEEKKLDEPQQQQQQSTVRLHIETEFKQPLYSYVPLPVFEIITYSFIHPMHLSINWAREIIKKFHAADQQQQQQHHDKGAKLHPQQVIIKHARSASVVEESDKNTHIPISLHHLERKRANLANLAQLDDQITNRITWQTQDELV